MGTLLLDQNPRTLVAPEDLCRLVPEDVIRSRCLPVARAMRLQVGIPPPRLNPTRYHGVFAPSARLRPWSPLAGGFLSGKYRRGQPPPDAGRLAKWKDRLAGFDPPRHWRTLEAVDAVAAELKLGGPEMAGVSRLARTRRHPPLQVRRSSPAQSSAAISSRSTPSLNCQGSTSRPSSSTHIGSAQVPPPGGVQIVPQLEISFGCIHGVFVASLWSFDPGLQRSVIQFRAFHEDGAGRRRV
jgi:hypothetical protein